MAATKKEGGAPTRQRVDAPTYCAFLLEKRLELQQQIIRLHARREQLELLVADSSLIIRYFETEDEVGFVTAPKKRLGFLTGLDECPAVETPDGATLIDEGHYRSFVIGQLITANAQIEGIAAYLQTIEGAEAFGLDVVCYQQDDGSVGMEMRPKKQIRKRKRS